MLTYGQKRQ